MLSFSVRNIFERYMIYFLAVSLVAKDIAIGAGGLGFDFWAGQIGHRVANDSPPLRHFFGAVLPKTLSYGDGPRHSWHASAYSASMMKIWFDFF